MSDIDFEWDEAKNASNYAKHGVDFERARLAFGDPFSIGWLDASDHYGEERLILVGMAEGTLLVVAYALRDERIRLISARRATRHEQDDYFKQNT